MLEKISLIFSGNTVSRKIIISSIQMLLSGFLMFYLYYFLQQSLGAEDVGLWALVLSVSSIASLSSMGLGSSSTIFIAKYSEEEKFKEIANLIESSILLVLLLFLVMLPFFYMGCSLFLEKNLSPENFNKSKDILPYVFFNSLFSIIGGVIYFSFDGIYKSEIRNIALIISQIGFIVLCIIFLPLYKNLLTLAKIQFFQSGVWSLFGWIYLKKYIVDLPLVPKKIHVIEIKKIWGQTIQYQVTSLVAMLVDPLAKSFINKAYGISYVGYYDMAFKICVQARAIIVSANQILLPYYASLVYKSQKNGAMESKNNTQDPIKLLKRNLTILVILGLPTLSLVSLNGLLISFLWLKKVDYTFVFFLNLLSVTFFVSLINVPSYFYNMASEKVYRNLYCYVIIIFAMFVIYLFNFFVGINFLVYAYPIGMLLGTIYLYYTTNVALPNKWFFLRNKIFITSFFVYSSSFVVIYLLPLKNLNNNELFIAMTAAFLIWLSLLIFSTKAFFGSNESKDEY